MLTWFVTTPVPHVPAIGKFKNMALAKDEMALRCGFGFCHEEGRYDLYTSLSYEENRNGKALGIRWSGFARLWLAGC